jgi:predicted dehydrogenase
MTILVIGGGKMGATHLALAAQYAGKANVAMCDPKRSVRTVFRMLGFRTYRGLEDARARGAGVTGVMIATPTSSHAPIAEAAIAAGLPVFVEKPLTLDPERSAALVAQARDAGVPAQTGFVLRYVGTFLRLRALVADGRLGAVERYEASMLGNVITEPPAPRTWQGDFARGGGALNEYGPHIIDLCNFVFGPVASIDRAEKGHTHCTNADDRISLDWRHANGTPGHLKIDWCDTTKRKSMNEFRVTFEKAEVRVDNSAVDLHWRDGVDLSEAARAELSAQPRQMNVGFYLRGEEFSLELEDFIGTCLGRSLHVDPDVPDDITPDLEAGYEVDRLIDAIARQVGLK